MKALAIAIFGTASWIALLPTVGRFWGHILAFWGARLELKSEVILVPQGWGSHIHFALPCFGLAAGPASGTAWWITTGVTVLAFIASFLLAEEALPWAYLIRAFCLLQATALGYFAVASARFPHDLPGYTVSMLVFSCILIGLVPVMYAFTFYLLNFSLLQKILLTLRDGSPPRAVCASAIYAAHLLSARVRPLHAGPLFRLWPFPRHSRLHRLLFMGNELEGAGAVGYLVLSPRIQGFYG